MKIRAANQNDCRLLFEWANDPDTRANSFSTDPLLWSNHCEWFKEKSASADTKILIGEDDSGPVGVVRFERDRDVAVVSITVNPVRRGQGLAKNLLTAATQQAIKESYCGRCTAFVKPQNTASLKLFEKCGWVRHNNSENDRVEFLYGEKRNK